MYNLYKIAECYTKGALSISDDKKAYVCLNTIKECNYRSNLMKDLTHHDNIANIGLGKEKMSICDLAEKLEK